MGWFDVVGDVVGDVGGAIVGAADKAAEGVAHVADTASDVVGAAATVVNTATAGLAEDVLELADDTILDAVDTATGGVVDIDYDDGAFSADVGIEGVAHVGAEVSQSGVRVESDSLIHDKNIGLTDDGLELGLAAGIDGISDHLPYTGLGVDLDTDGDIAIEAEAHGTVPTPYGIFSGRADSAIHQNEAGFAGYFDTDGQWIMTDGDVVGGNLAVGYAENDQGSQLSVEAGGSYTSASGFTVGGQAGYGRVETADGTIVEAFEGSVTGGYRGVTHTVSHQDVSIEPGPAGLPAPASAAAPDPTAAPIGGGSPATPAPDGLPSAIPASDGLPAATPAIEDPAPEPVPSIGQTVAMTDAMTNDVDDLFTDL